MRHLFSAALLSLVAVLPAAAETSLWRCELSPVSARSAFYSGILLIAFDNKTGQVWVRDPGLGLRLETGFIPAKVDISGGTVDMRWKVRLPVQDGPEVLRFGYQAGFDAGGGQISLRAWLDEGKVNTPGPDKVSGPCKRV